MAGNFRERTLRVEPTGEKQRTTYTIRMHQVSSNASSDNIVVYANF